MADRVESLDEFGKTKVVISDKEKSQTEYTVAKSRDGFVFYEIKASQGKLAPQLEGRFTRVQDAEKVIFNYLKTMKVTPHTRTKKRAEARAEEKARD